MQRAKSVSTAVHAGETHMTQGSSTLIAKTLGLVKAGADLKHSIAKDPDWTRIGLEAFHTRLVNAERDAVRHWLEVQGLIHGDMNAALLAWLAARGIADAAKAEGLLAMAMRAQQSTERDAYTLAKELVRKRVMADPDERRRALQEIFGMMPVADAPMNALDVRNALPPVTA